MTRKRYEAYDIAQQMEVNLTVVKIEADGVKRAHGNARWTRSDQLKCPVMVNHTCSRLHGQIR